MDYSLEQSTNLILLADLVITAIGFILLFVSDQAVTLIATPYPPFGLVSVSAVGLSSYLILVGLYYSAISLSNDVNLRRTIRESVLRESKFLDSIGKSIHGTGDKIRK